MSEIATKYIGCVIPTQQFITQKSAPKLYTLEEKAKEAMMALARERCIVAGVEPQEKWTVGLPQALCDVLQGFSPDVAVAVFLGWLRSRDARIMEADEQFSAVVRAELDRLFPTPKGAPLLETLEGLSGEDTAALERNIAD